MPRKQKVGLISAMGSGFQIIKELVEEIRRQEGTEDDVRQLLVAHAQEILRGHGGRAAVGAHAVAHDAVPVGGRERGGPAPLARGDVGAEDLPDHGVVHHDAAPEVPPVTVSPRAKFPVCPS